MRTRLWQYAILRPATMIPIGLGLWASLSRSWIGVGVALIVYGIVQAFKLVNNTPNAEERVFLRQEKKRRGIQRSLNDQEQKYLLQLMAYTKKLEKLGGDPTLGRELFNQAWMAIESNRSTKDNRQLEALIESLPKLQPTGTKPQEDLLQRLKQECEIIYASQAEANASSKNYKW